MAGTHTVILALITNLWPCSLPCCSALPSSLFLGGHPRLPRLDEVNNDQNLALLPATRPSNTWTCLSLCNGELFFLLSYYFWSWFLLWGKSSIFFSIYLYWLVIFWCFMVFFCNFPFWDFFFLWSFFLYIFLGVFLLCLFSFLFFFLFWGFFLSFSSCLFFFPFPSLMNGLFITLFLPFIYRFSLPFTFLFYPRFPLHFFPLCHLLFSSCNFFYLPSFSFNFLFFISYSLLFGHFFLLFLIFLRNMIMILKRPNKRKENEKVCNVESALTEENRC